MGRFSLSHCDRRVGEKACFRRLPNGLVDLVSAFVRLLPRRNTPSGAAEMKAGLFQSVHVLVYDLQRSPDFVAKREIVEYCCSMKAMFHSVLICSSLVLFSCSGDAPDEVEAEAEEVAIVGLVDVDAEKAAGLVASNVDLVILDVRTPAEFAEGHLAGSVNIDFQGANFAEEIGKLDPSKAYLMHCRSGRRSGAALPVFEGLNFSELYHLESGYLGWTEAGQPVEK